MWLQINESFTTVQTGIKVKLNPKIKKTNR